MSWFNKFMFDYGKDYGIQLEKDRILQLLEEEQKRTKLGFVQYQRIQELLDDRSNS